MKIRSENRARTRWRMINATSRITPSWNTTAYIIIKQNLQPEERVEGRGWALQTHLHLVLDKRANKGAWAAGMFTVNKHYDIIFCHNNGRRCYKRFSHEAAVGYHCGQWERPRYAVNWFAKAFLKKPSAERAGPAAAAAVRAARLGWMGVARAFELIPQKLRRAGIVFMLHNYATRDCSDRDREKGGGGCDGGRWGKKQRLAEKKFFGGWSARPRRASNAIRLMNRNNSRAVVLFGSFQLTAPFLPRFELHWATAKQAPNGATHCFKFLCRANAPRGS